MTKFVQPFAGCMAAIALLGSAIAGPATAAAQTRSAQALPQAAAQPGLAPYARTAPIGWNCQQASFPGFQPVPQLGRIEGPAQKPPEAGSLSVSCFTLQQTDSGEQGGSDAVPEDGFQYGFLFLGIAALTVLVIALTQGDNDSPG